MMVNKEKFVSEKTADARRHQENEAERDTYEALKEQYEWGIEDLAEETGKLLDVLEQKNELPTHVSVEDNLKLLRSRIEHLEQELVLYTARQEDTIRQKGLSGDDHRMPSLLGKLQSMRDVVFANLEARHEKLLKDRIT